MSSSSKQKVVEVKTRKHGARLEPLRVEFNNGTLKADATESAGVGLYSDSLSDDYVAVCQVGEIPYMGTVLKDTSDKQKTYLAIRNKSTQKIKLIELGKVTLAPVLQFPASTNPMLLDEEKEEVEGEEKKAKRSELNRGFVQKFGMLRGQRLYDQAERLTVKAEVVRANLENAAVKTSVEATELVPTNDESFDYLLPQRNIDATEASDVYQLEDVVSAEDLLSLNSLAEYCLVAETSEIEAWRENGEYSSVFTDRLLLLRRPNKLEAETQLRRIGALIYAELLIKVVTLKSADWRRKDPLPGEYPLDVRRRCLERFVPRASGQRSFSQIDRERVVCHLMALLLVIGDCYLDLKLLADSLKMAMDKLVPLVQVVGAHHVQDKVSGVATATLRLPLAAPPKKAYSAKKKQRK